MQIGIYPYDIAEKYGVNVSRKVVYASLWNGGQPFTKTILLNINNNTSHAYAKDPNVFAEKAVKIYNTLKPELVVVENEELLKQTSSGPVVRTLDDVKLYCNELGGAANALPGKVTNGGLTLPELSYWYYSRTQDEEFFKNNIPTNHKQELINGEKAQTIYKVEYLLNAISVLPVAGINVHYYFGLPTQVPGLIRMFNYLKQYGLLLSNEAGIYATGLLPQCVDIAKQTEMLYLILYSGGLKSALSISKTDFESVIQ